MTHLLTRYSPIRIYLDLVIELEWSLCTSTRGPVVSINTCFSTLLYQLIKFRDLFHSRRVLLLCLLDVRCRILDHIIALVWDLTFGIKIQLHS